MNKLVKEFYLKNKEKGYCDDYDESHGPRVDFCIKRFGLDKLKHKRIVDVGCGRGNFFKRLDSDNTFVGLDGADIDPELKLCDFLSLKVDFNSPDFGYLFDNEGKFDYLICSETIEHVSHIDNLMLGMKSLLKEDGSALFTIPHHSVTHPVAFPGLFFPEQNFKVFIEQYAWIVEDEEVFRDCWHTCCFQVRNAPMIEQIPVFPKGEQKFWGQNPIDWTNL